MRLFLPLAVVLCTTAVGRPARAADDLEARAERLAALRGEVAALQAALAERQDATSTELRALDAQRVDLDVQARREELRLAKLQDDLAAALLKTQADAGLEDAVKPALDRGFAALRAQVAVGLPFRTDERLAALDELQAQVDRGDLVPSKAIGRLWAFVEDELRLSRENVLDRQVVPLDRGEVLAEVARLGTAAMFFRSPDGAVGHVRRADTGWTWVVLSDPARIREVEALFDALRKGIRTGWFELPWAFGEVPR